jgi:hypothetical protein
MNLEKENREGEDVEMEAALRHFRQSVHAWSEHEYGRAAIRDAEMQRERRSGGWWMIKSPAMGWALAAAVVVSGVAVPTAIHHQRQIVAEQVATQRAAAEQARQKLAADAAREAAPAMSDDELLSHVDSDIAQSTPDAMEPLARLMSDTNEQ